MKPTGSTDPNMLALLRKLRMTGTREKVKIWKQVAEELSRSNRRRVVVNLSIINRIIKEGETILVPGKVLGAGDLDQSVTIAARDYSSQAREKIETAGGTCLTIAQLMERNPKGSSVRIITS